MVGAMRHLTDLLGGMLGLSGCLATRLPPSKLLVVTPNIIGAATNKKRLQTFTTTNSCRTTKNFLDFSICKFFHVSLVLNNLNKEVPLASKGL